MQDNALDEYSKKSRDVGEGREGQWRSPVSGGVGFSIHAAPVPFSSSSSSFQCPRKILLICFSWFIETDKPRENSLP